MDILSIEKRSSLDMLDLGGTVGTSSSMGMDISTNTLLTTRCTMGMEPCMTMASIYSMDSMGMACNTMDSSRTMDRSI